MPPARRLLTSSKLWVRVARSQFLKSHLQHNKRKAASIDEPINRQSYKALRLTPLDWIVSLFIFLS